LHVFEGPNRLGRVFRMARKQLCVVRNRSTARTRNLRRVTIVATTQGNKIFSPLCGSRLNVFSFRTSRHLKRNRKHDEWHFSLRLFSSPGFKIIFFVRKNVGAVLKPAPT